MVTAIGFFLPMAFFPEWAGDETSEDNTGQCTYGIGGQVEPITGPVGGAIGLCQFDEATHGYRAYVKGKARGMEVKVFRARQSSVHKMNAKEPYISRCAHLSIKRTLANSILGGVNSERYQITRIRITVIGWLFIHFVSSCVI